MENSATKGLFMIAIRIALVLLGLYIIRLYIPPLISLGVLNLGNIFGMGAGAAIALFGIILPKIISFVKQQIESGHKKPAVAVLSVICALILAFLIAFFATLGSVVAASHQTATNQNTVIVLGCQIRGSVPSMSLNQRCMAAVKYMNENPDAVAIASGGQGSDEDLSEGQCIFNIMTENGIAPDRIFIEDKSTNTDENIAFSKKIIDEKGLSTDVAVATNEYHEKRAIMICKKNGITAYSVPAPSSKWGKPTFFTREVFAIWAQLL